MVRDLFHSVAAHPRGAWAHCPYEMAKAAVVTGKGAVRRQASGERHRAPDPAVPARGAIGRMLLPLGAQPASSPTRTGAVDSLRERTA